MYLVRDVVLVCFLWSSPSVREVRMACFVARFRTLFAACFALIFTSLFVYMWMPSYGVHKVVLSSNIVAPQPQTEWLCKIHVSPFLHTASSDPVHAKTE